MSPMNPASPSNPSEPSEPAGADERASNNDPGGGTAPGTARAWGSEPPLKEPANPGSAEAPEDAAMAPDDVGVSTTRRGEDVIKEEDKEAGRERTEADASPAGRPAGESSPRHATGVKTPKDPETATPHSP
jgi:hypothetical protein